MVRITVASALMALASLVSAQKDGYHAITKPGLSEEVQAGTTYTITWTYAPAYPGNVVLGLIGGDTQGTQVPLYTVGTADGAAGQLSWKVDCAYKGQAFYGLTITSADNPTNFQYSTPFKVVDSSACSSSSSASSSASATVTATLSSVSSSSTVVRTNTTTTTTCDSSSSAVYTTSLAPKYNTTLTTQSKSAAVVTSTSYSTAVRTTAAGSTPTAPVTAGATRIGSSIVMLAGVAAAFFVL